MTQSKELRERFAGMGIEPLSSTPEQFGEFLRAEVARWSKVIRESGAKAD